MQARLWRFWNYCQNNVTSDKVTLLIQTNTFTMQIVNTADKAGNTYKHYK